MKKEQRLLEQVDGVPYKIIIQKRIVTSDSELQKVLGWSRTIILRLKDCGMPRFEIDGHTFYDLDAIYKWIEEGRTQVYTTKALQKKQQDEQKEEQPKRETTRTRKNKIAVGSQFNKYKYLTIS